MCMSTCRSEYSRPDIEVDASVCAVSKRASGDKLYSWSWSNAVVFTTLEIFGLGASSTPVLQSQRVKSRNTARNRTIVVARARKSGLVGHNSDTKNLVINGKTLKLKVNVEGCFDLPSHAYLCGGHTMFPSQKG